MGPSDMQAEAGHVARPAGERHTATSVLRTNTVTFYMKSRFELRDWRLRVVSPRAILGVIPTGRVETTYPLEDLGRMDVGSRFYPSRFAVAALLGALSFIDAGVAARAVAGLLAACFLFLSWVVVVRVEDRTGRRRIVPVCWFQAGPARGLVAQVNRARSRLPP